jgi:hypothetical protein
MVASDDLLDLESLAVVSETLLQLGVLATRTRRGLGWSQYRDRQSPPILCPIQCQSQSADIVTHIGVMIFDA